MEYFEILIDNISKQVTETFIDLLKYNTDDIKNVTPNNIIEDNFHLVTKEFIKRLMCLHSNIGIMFERLDILSVDMKETLLMISRDYDNYSFLLNIRENDIWNMSVSDSKKMILGLKEKSKELCDKTIILGFEPADDIDMQIATIQNGIIRMCEDEISDNYKNSYFYNCLKECSN